MTTTDRTDWGLVLLLWLAGLGAAGQYAKVSVVYDRLAEFFPGAGSALGFAVSLVGFVGIALGIVAGVLVGRIGYRRAMIGGLLAGAVMSLYQASLPAFAPFLISRVVEGAAHLLIVVAAPTLIAEAAGDKGRGFALTLWGTFFGVAFAVLAWAGVPLADRFGPGALFAAHGGYMALFAALLFVILPKRPPPEPQPIPGFFEAHRAIYRSPFISAPAIGWLFYTFCFLSTLTFLPDFVAPEMRSFVQGGMPLMSIIASMTLGVWLLKRTSAIWVVRFGFILSACLLNAIWFMAPGSVILCLAYAGALGLVQGASFAAVPELNPAMDDRARANGALAQMGNLGNTLGTPVVAWIIVAAGQTAMLPVVAIILALGFVAHGMLARARARAKP